MKQQIDILLTECAQRRKERGAPPPGAKKRVPATPAGVANATASSRPSTPLETPKGRNNNFFIFNYFFNKLRDTAHPKSSTFAKHLTI